MESPNGSPLPGPSRLPRQTRPRWGTTAKVFIALGAVVLVVGGAGTGYLIIGKPFSKGRNDLVLHKVGYERLELTITERGQLESGNNNDIVCKMKARAQGSNVASTIKWAIDDGSHVQKDHHPQSEIKGVLSWNPAESRYVEETLNANGSVRVVKVEDKPGSGRFHYSDLLAELDDSGLQDTLKTQKITLDKAESDKVQAEEEYKITESQNKSDIEKAMTDLTIAELDLMKYTGWTRKEVDQLLTKPPEEVATDKPGDELAKRDLERYLRGDYVASLKDLIGKVESAKSDLDLQVERAAWASRMVKKGFQSASQAQGEYSKRDSYENALRKATLDLDVMVKYTRRQEETKRKRAVEEGRLSLERAKAQARAKEKKAETDRNAKRLVHNQEQSRFKEIESEIKKSVLYAPQDGMVVYYVDERMRFGQGRQAMVAQGEQVTEGQKLMQIPDLGHMLANVKVHEALVSRVKAPFGQPAIIKVGSFSDKVLRGKVESVATVAAAADWFAGDVKMYPTKVALETKLEGLKPGMTAEVTITTGDPLERVLTVPVESVVGGAELGQKRQIYVMTPKGPEPRDVVLGQSNDTKVEIKSGLQEGDEVVLNPKVLVGDRAKTRQPGEGGNGNGGEDKSGGQPAAKTAPGSPDGKAGPGTGKQPGGPDGKGGPAAGKDKAGGGGLQQPSAEQMKQMQKWKEDFDKASPEKKKQMAKELIQRMPEEYREATKQRFKEQGIEVD